MLNIQCIRHFVCFVFSCYSFLQLFAPFKCTKQFFFLKLKSLYICTGVFASTTSTVSYRNFRSCALSIPTGTYMKLRYLTSFILLFHKYDLRKCTIYLHTHTHTEHNIFIYAYVKECVCEIYVAKQKMCGETAILPCTKHGHSS